MIPGQSLNNSHGIRLYENKRSVGGKYWQMRSEDERLSMALSQKFGLSYTAGQIMAGRGLTLETSESYLSPKLRDLMPDPIHLKDMDMAILRLMKALEKKEKIAIFGDYDVDGATSSALLKRYFRSIGHDVFIYIPDRIDEGYGPNAAALRYLKRQGIDLVVMVDCGTTSFEPLKVAQDMQLDVIVVDHHAAQPLLPPAIAVINPNRLDETSSLTNLCAAGVSFMMLVALHRLLRQQGWFSKCPEPDLRQYLDLVALGTVCDVMPLTGLNRAFVAQGLQIMRQRGNQGLMALSDVAGLSEIPSAYHLGFVLGPRINAGGRVGKSDLGSRLLSTLDFAEAKALASQLHQLNQERQAIEMEVTEEAYRQIDRFALHKNPVLVVQGEGWHPGVIGIVASRVKEKYFRPSCVVGFDNEVGKGSGRSISGVHLGAAMHAAQQQSLLVNGGGHAMAAGFTVLKDRYTAFHDFLQERLGGQVASTEPTLDIDAILSPSGVSKELLKGLCLMEPFGAANPTPKFVLSYVTVAYAEQVGINHIRCQFMGQDGVRLKGMAFRALDTDLGTALLSKRQRLFHAAGSLKLDSWGGREDVVFFVDDLMEA